MIENKKTRISLLYSRFKNYLKQIVLQPEATPKQMALSFAIGLAVAFSPLVGLHTCIVLILCVSFNKLHRPLMLLACYFHNPWTLLPLTSASVLIGNLLIGHGGHLNLGGVNWRIIGWRSFVTRQGFNNLCVTLKPIVVPYVLGGFVLSILALPLGYYVMLKVIRHLRALESRSIKTKSPEIK